VRLSELYAQLKTAGDVHAFSVYLATPDLDGVDVDRVPVGRVEVNDEKGEARLYSASTSADVDSVDTTGDNNLRLMVEVPLLRTEAGGDAIGVVGLDGPHVGAASEEVWLLAVPASMFAAGLLPA
jgi:hypothetical protein